jgi:palmitoyltransferase
MSGDTLKRRANGFSWPWHPFQLATWLLFILIAVHYFSFLMPLLWGHIAIKVLVTFAFGVSFLSSGVFAVITCATDPADDYLKAGGNSNDNSYIDAAYCYWCERHVLSSTKHCNTCRKCIARFDHHCLYV